MEEEKTTQDSVLEKVESKINELVNTEGVKRENVDYLYKLVDIHKDLKNEKYWKVKEEKYNDEIQRNGIWSKNERLKRALHGRLW